MDQLFTWLLSDPTATTILLVSFGILVVALPLIYVIAFFQGRSLSFWPPKIGEKSEKAEEAARSEKENARKTVAQDGIWASWVYSSPTAQSILEGAESSILLLGTSNFRVVHSDLYLYREWLQEDSRRILGMLCLNPYSPHAFRREGRDVQRSSAENIIQSIRAAYLEVNRNPQFILAVYDGPYRYSARAANLGTGLESKNSIINLFTSSHKRGTSTGFHIVLSGADASPPHSFYRQELLDLWKSALANPPGHGISIVCQTGLPPGWETPEELYEPLLSRLGLGIHDVHLFPSEQLHLTVAAICRTQTTPYKGPLSIWTPHTSEGLPSHFGEFLCDVLHSTADLCKTELTCSLDRVVLDERGYVMLASDHQVESTAIETVNEFLDRIHALVSEYAEKYPEEPWRDRKSGRVKGRFGPKFDRFMPHIAVGMVFSRTTSLPTPFKGRTESIPLPAPLGYVVSELSVVHYAYRSLQRCMGEIVVSPTARTVSDPSVALRTLGIKMN
jgi:hypothetical protein